MLGAAAGAGAGAGAGALQGAGAGAGRTNCKKVVRIPTKLSTASTCIDLFQVKPPNSPYAIQYPKIFGQLNFVHVTHPLPGAFPK